MNTMARWVVERAGLAWTLVLSLALLCGWITAQVTSERRQSERLSLLQTEAVRGGVEIMSQTLNGNVMGALGLLGLIDPELKREARGEVQGHGKGERRVPLDGKAFALSETNLDTLESVTRSSDTEGTFLVRNDGLIGAAWYSSGQPSFGNNVKFRPYFQMAMQGIENVYAAVGTGQAKRMLYYSAPVFAETTNASDVIGAVVARVSLVKIDHLLRDKADIALLLSPQDVVFAASKAEWVAHIAGTVTPERLKGIREIKQFGDLLANKDPEPLPMSIESGIRPFEGKSFAVARTKVPWNDPQGDWTLVLMEDLSRTVPLVQRLKSGLLAGVLVFVFGGLWLRMLRGHHAQVTAARQLDALARQQQAHAEHQAAIAAIGLRLQQSVTLDDLGKRYLTELHSLFGIVLGTVYVLAENDDMKLCASYACVNPPAPTLRLGEGLLGQCAVEKRLLRLDAPAAGDLWRIHSGLGSSRPRCLLMAPILLNGTLLGAIEVALMTQASTNTEQALTETNKLLALNVEILRRSVHTEALLALTAEAERASTERARFQQVLIDTIPYPVFYKGADTRFLGVNRAYEQTFKVRREDLVGKRVLDLEYLPQVDRLNYQAEDEAMIAASGAAQREMAMPFADGQLHDTLYHVSGFCNADGSPGGLVGTFIDITAQKEAQKNLERLADAERFNRLSLGREARILQLKDEVNALCQRLSELPRYVSAQKLAQAEATRARDADLPLGEHLKLVQLNWHSAYECGQADIDREHHVLFGIANELINAVVAGRSPQAIQHIIDRLVQEVVQHFAHEEAILRDRGYAALEEHVAIHTALVDQAVHLIGEFKAGRAESGPFFQFLAYDVIARHMLGEDRKFFPLFQSTTAHAVFAPSSTVPPLAELVDLDELQTLFSAFCESVGIAAAIIDLQAHVLASSRWQRACTDFHRVNPESCARCIESDTNLAQQLQEGQNFTMYRCKNGMTDCASPIIVEGHHLANVFIGQFHLGPPDLAFFRQQARQYGYDEAEYLQAVQEAPVADEKRLPVILGFLTGFARLVSTMSLARHRADEAQQRLQQQAEEVQRQRIAALSLAEDAEQTRLALEAVAKEKQA